MTKDEFQRRLQRLQDAICEIFPEINEEEDPDETIIMLKAATRSSPGEEGGGSHERFFLHGLPGGMEGALADAVCRDLVAAHIETCAGCQLMMAAQGIDKDGPEYPAHFNQQYAQMLHKMMGNIDGITIEYFPGDDEEGGGAQQSGHVH